MISKPINKENVGESLAGLVSSLAVLTARDQDEGSAILVSWMQQASFNPPMLTVSLKKGRAIATLLRDTKKFVLNILGEDNKDLLKIFAHEMKAGEDSFVGLTTLSSDYGVILKESAAYLECFLRAVYDAGDSQIYLAEVMDGALLHETKPMVHVRKSGWHY